MTPVASRVPAGSPCKAQLSCQHAAGVSQSRIQHAASAPASLLEGLQVHSAGLSGLTSYVFDPLPRSQAPGAHCNSGCRAHLSPPSRLAVQQSGCAWQCRLSTRCMTICAPRSRFAATRRASHSGTHSHVGVLRRRVTIQLLLCSQRMLAG